MTQPGARRAAALSPAPGRPALIAHSAGNTASRARAAIAECADFLEVDLWVHRGRFEARHERRLPARVPLLLERWYVTRPPRVPFGLAELLAESAGEAGVFLDLKNGGAVAAQLIRRSLRGHDGGARLVASSQSWSLLREVKAICPGVDVYYSVDAPAQLDLLFSVMTHDRAPAGASCRHSLLSEEVVEDLHAAGLSIVAWTVDDPQRARTLARWGVDALTTQRAAALRAALATGG